MSGYSIKITAFLPCGKDNAAHTFASGSLAQIKEALELVGCEEIDMRDEFKPNRKSVPAPAVSDSAVSGALDTAPEDKRLTSASPPIGDTSSGAGDGADTTAVPT